MYEFDLSAAQQELIDLPFPSTTCLTGPAGAGKTTAALAYLSNLVSQGIRQENICIIAPQRNLLDPYLRLINAREFPAGAPPRLMTFGGLARRMVSLFWPLVIEPAGFSGASKYPTFLTHETAQYHLAKLASPLIQNERYFEGAAIHPSRLYSQIIDNLNKAAIVGYPYQANAEKLRAAWTGDSTACIIYDQAQHCSQLFREYCLQNNLLDFSLQVEVFRDFIWNSELFKKYWYGGNKHLIYDNAEEDAPVFHDLVLDWMPDLESALFIMDDDGGYRTFLAADPISADRIKDSCRRVLQFENSFVQSPEVSQVTALLSRAIHGEWLDKRTQDLPSFKVFTHRFIPEMVTAVCHYCADLIQSGVPADEIVIISPFLSDSLQFSLLSRLQDLGVPAVSSRPSRSLADEPAVRCLLTWAKLAHPRWHFPCSREELRSALYQSIDDADLIKVDRLSRIVYKEKLKELTSFDDIDADIQLLISPAVGNRYEIIRNWLLEYVSADPADLDVFLSRLFGEVLSQPGFHMHNDLQQASVCERLIESARKFRHAQNPNEDAHPIDRGEAYIDMVLSGVIAATPTFDPSKNDGAILVAPAYAYLMQNRPVEIQVWLDVGARAWWERLFQPLTHPHVLSRHWTSARKWTDSDEVHYNQLMLERLVIGLTRRCKKQLVLHASGMNEQGYEDRGPLLRVIQTVLRALPRERAASDV